MYPRVRANGRGLCVCVGGGGIEFVRHIYPEHEGHGMDGCQVLRGCAGMVVDKRCGVDDVILIKYWDNGASVDGWMGRKPNMGFKHPRNREGSPGKEFIEVRCLAIGWIAGLSFGFCDIFCFFN